MIQERAWVQARSFIAPWRAALAPLSEEIVALRLEILVELAWCGA